VAVQQGRDPVGVGEDAGDVGGGREAAHHQRPPRQVGEAGLQLGEVELAVGVLADLDHLGGRLAPGQQVGVVLERPDQHHRPGPGRDRRPPQLQQAGQLGHRPGGPRPAEHDQVLVGTADGLVDQLAGVLAQAGGVAAGPRALGVGVGVARQDLVADGVLDEVEGLARRGPVGVGDPPRLERPGQRVAVADDPAADPLDQRLGI
jgi:hypothetical protein